MARIFPAELDAQYGVTISTLLSQASTLKRNKQTNTYDTFKMDLKLNIRAKWVNSCYRVNLTQTIVEI